MLELAGFDRAFPQLFTIHTHHADAKLAVVFGAGEVDECEGSLVGAAARHAEEIQIALVVLRIGGKGAES